MGVYYDASIGWGLRVPQSDRTRGEDLEDVYDLPPGFLYNMGGDHMSGENISYLIHPPRAIRVVLKTIGYRESGFGIHSVDEVYQPTDDELETLVVFARQNGLDEDIGWFAISSVG